MKRFNKSDRLRIGLTAVLLATALPVLGQDSPESILPPGFGEPEVELRRPPSRVREPREDGPEDILPPDDEPDYNAREPSRPRSSGGSFSAGPLPSLPPLASTVPSEKKEGEEGEEGTPVPILQDLPAHARRSTDKVGVLAIDDGDMGEGAFGVSRGGYLMHLMRKLEAPIASRWASITLRRALLSKVKTPEGINGADFTAERAYLLMRMGEADPSRMLVEAVDADQYTPWMKTVAMQSALASADPAGMCPAAEGHPAAGKDGFWMLARAMCSAFSGESSLASALVDQARDKDKAEAIDALLAEKVVGAASNSRRSINILWEDVSKLSAWRFGLATATGLPIPQPLMDSAGLHVRAWRARAPLLSPLDRIDDAEIAAALGVFSGSALLDHYALLSEDGGPGAGGPIVENLSTAFGGDNATEKVNALKTIWNDKANDPLLSYSHLIATSRAAALIPVGDAGSGEADRLIASMMTTGLDVQASRWANSVSGGSLGWAVLAVGSPEPVKGLSAGDIKGIDEGRTGKRAQFLLAGLAGLGRIDATMAGDVAEDLEVPIGRQNAWTKAIARAADGRESATVALLVAVGLQGRDWKAVQPSQLFHAVAALRRVGLESAARMIAAEAVMRG